MKCYNCNSTLNLPPLWFPGSAVHEMSQSLPIWLRQQCCGVQSHTEGVATITAYLQPVKENARLVCNLVNQYILVGRPEPAWLTEAWANWEESFERPPFRSTNAQR